MKAHNLLVATDLVDDKDVRELSRHAAVYKLADYKGGKLSDLLTVVDCLLVFSWPAILTKENLQLMTRLRFIQSILAGVNHIPFTDLNKNVIVSSNAGAYSDAVAEYAWALLLSAAKRIVDMHNSVKDGKWTLRRTVDTGRDITVLNGKTLGMLGYGGIAASVAKKAAGWGMRIYAYARTSRHVKHVRFLQGKNGLSDLLRGSDAVVLALPLTNQTTHIISENELAVMKPGAIIVNVARGELVDERAMYDHLTANPNFRYATDVWWYREGRESLKTDYPFLSLPNFVGTPHLSGPSGLATGKPVKLAVENTIRFLKGLKPKNTVDPSEYLAQDPQPY
jgi:phosphoglycerate dehydrogenase-like enzyme